MLQVKLLFLLLLVVPELFCMELSEPKPLPIAKRSLFARVTGLFMSQDPFLTVTEESINHFFAIKCFENTSAKLTKIYNGSFSFEKIKNGSSLQTKQGLMLEVDKSGIPVCLISPWGLLSIDIKINDKDKDKLRKDILQSLLGFWKQELGRYILQGIQSYTLPHEQTFIIQGTARSLQKVNQAWNQLEQYYIQCLKQK